MRPGIKHILQTLAFLLAAALLLGFVNWCFTPADSHRMEKLAFYAEPRESLDVVFLGSSSSLRAVSPMALYGDYGIKSYSMANMLQAPPVTLFTARQALKRQSPRVIVVSLDSLLSDYDYSQRESFVHTALDPYPLSVDKLRCAWAVARRDPEQGVLDYLFPVLRYHDTWHAETETGGLKKQVSHEKGFLGMNASLPVTPAGDYMMESGAAAAFNEDAAGYYREMIGLCRSAGAAVLIVKFPRTTWTLEEHTAMARFAAETGAGFLDFNLPELRAETGLDFATDYCDVNHVCLSGALKLTDYLGAYLKEHWDLPDRRGDGSSYETLQDEYRETNMFCLHAVPEGRSMALSVSTLEIRTGLRYSFSLYREGAWLHTATEEDPVAVLPAELPGTYVACCEIFRGDESIQTIYSPELTIE